ncbi:MAG: helix-turn-helix transcriptional regulator [Gammaproteobacteria bacterium]|nr:helix-turn-helix transcriptional regulator [Gammaproteobacteria bacterium]
MQIDKDLAIETREKGCPRCGGVLHSACYPRKIKESCVPLDGKEIVRFSFCCSTDGCRRRITPPSVRFLGRKRYLGVVVILVSAMLHGLTQRRAEELAELAGISHRTLSRWKTWWQEAFPASRFWSYSKAFIVPPLDPACLCRDLVERFSAQYEMVGMVRLLRFLSPLNCHLPVVERQAF